MTASSAIPPVDTYAPGLRTRVPAGSLAGIGNILLGLGAVALIASFIGGLTADDHGKQFYFSYLVNYMFTLGLALGALFFVVVQHVARAGWSIVVRRVAENIAWTLPVLAVLTVPIIVGHDQLFGHWMHAEITDTTAANYDAIIAGKSSYLNQPFFFVRMGIYFLIWIGMTVYFRGKSIEQDENGNPELSLKMARIGAPGLVLFAFSITFAAFDWMMSLNPHWFSTMYGVTYFAGSVMAFLATLALVCMWLGKRNLLKDVVNIEHYHDIGKLMFAFMIFWAYVNFSQYFLIQYADLPEETQWFQQRFHGSWFIIGVILCAGHFIVPFIFLLSRHMKRNRTPLAIGAVLLLVMHWFDMQFNIMPNGGHGFEEFGVHWLDITTLIGVFGIFLGLTIRNIGKTNLFPTRDPKLKESLKFLNF